jgi:hypothetical protein
MRRFLPAAGLAILGLGCLGPFAASVGRAIAAEDEATETVEVKEEALQVSISLPKRFDKRTVSLGATPEAFHVVVTNVTKEPVRLWREWCSWGYFNLFFEVQFGEEKPLKMVKELRGWDKNYPDFAEIAAGEHLVLEVKLDPGVWRIPFEKAGEPRAARLRAIYAVEPDDESKRHVVWTGRVESRSIDVMLHDHRP